jgi:murein DD-endopeptidase MepM/ murein hydrolase activator NlpD
MNGGRRRLAVALAVAFAACAGAAAPLPVPAAASARPVAREPAPARFVLEGSATQGGMMTGTAPAGTTGLTLDGQAVPVDAEGRFLIAFDRDAGPRARLSAVLDDGRTVVETLDVAPRAWRIERVDAPLRPTRDTEAFLALRRPELARIAAARAMQTDARGWRRRFAWPRIGRISGLFGAQRIYRGQPGAYHGGIDIASATGDAVFAPADGVVILAADHPFTLEGNLLMIDHGAGLNSAFLHLSRIDVRAGDHVVKGQRIGAAGATGRATGPHLHWALKWHEARIDPLLIAGPMPAR